MADEIRKLQEDRASGRIALTAKGGGFDSDIYGEEDRSAYNQFLPSNDLMEDDDEDAGGGGGGSTHPSSRSRINPSRFQALPLQERPRLSSHHTFSLVKPVEPFLFNFFDMWLGTNLKVRKL